MKEIYEMKGACRSVRGIARELGIARNTVRRYLNSPAAMRPKPRRQRSSKLDAYVAYIERRLGKGWTTALCCTGSCVNGATTGGIRS